MENDYKQTKEGPETTKENNNKHTKEGPDDEGK